MVELILLSDWVFDNWVFDNGAFHWRWFGWSGEWLFGWSGQLLIPRSTWSPSSCRLLLLLTRLLLLLSRSGGWLTRLLQCCCWVEVAVGWEVPAVGWTAGPANHVGRGGAETVGWQEVFWVGVVVVFPVLASTGLLLVPGAVAPMLQPVTVMYGTCRQNIAQLDLLITQIHYIMNPHGI